MGWGGGSDLLKFCVPHVFKVPQILGYVRGWAECVYLCIFLDLFLSIKVIYKTYSTRLSTSFAPFENTSSRSRIELESEKKACQGRGSPSIIVSIPRFFDSPTALL